MLKRTSAILFIVIVFSASVLFLASGAVLAQTPVGTTSYQGTAYTIGILTMGALSTDTSNYPAGTAPGTWPLPGSNTTACPAGQWEFRYEVSFTPPSVSPSGTPTLSYMGMNIPACIPVADVTCTPLSCTTSPLVLPCSGEPLSSQNFWKLSKSSGPLLTAGPSFDFSICSPWQNSANTRVEFDTTTVKCDAGTILGPACQPNITSTAGSTIQTSTGLLELQCNSAGNPIGGEFTSGSNQLPLGPANYWLCPNGVCSQITVAGDLQGVVFQYGNSHDPVGVIIGGAGLGVSVATVTVNLNAVSKSGSSIAVPAGAQWNLDGGPWQTSGQTVGVTAAGSHIINFYPVA